MLKVKLYSSINAMLIFQIQRLTKLLKNAFIKVTPFPVPSVKYQERPACNNIKDITHFFIINMLISAAEKLLISKT